ncbi:hypothetical protein [Actinoplanes sp. NPDC026619]
MRDGFHLIQRFAHPEAIGTTQFVPWYAHHLMPYRPLLQWLTQHTST